MVRAAFFFSVAIAACSLAKAAEPTQRELERALTETVAPFLKTYCQECHARQQPKAKLDLTIYSTLSKVAENHAAWETVRERLEAKEMPPEEAKKQPTAAEREAVIGGIL